MGYFSNGTEAELFREAYCHRCANWRDLEDGRGPGCPVIDAHFLYAYEERNSGSNAEQILDLLIEYKTRTASDGLPVVANECAMFVRAEADTPEHLPVPANADKRYDEMDGG